MLNEISARLEILTHTVKVMLVALVEFPVYITSYHFPQSLIIGLEKSLKCHESYNPLVHVTLSRRRQ